MRSFRPSSPSCVASVEFGKIRTHRPKWLRRCRGQPCRSLTWAGCQPDQSAGPSAQARGQNPESRASRWRTGAAVSQPGLQNVRNSVLGFVAKPLTLHNEKPNAMVRRVAITRRALFSCFSLRLLAAPATRRDFEGAPLFFSAQGGGTR